MKRGFRKFVITESIRNGSIRNESIRNESIRNGSIRNGSTKKIIFFEFILRRLKYLLPCPIHFQSPASYNPLLSLNLKINNI